jgi:hypothetical protein
MQIRCPPPNGLCGDQAVPDQGRQVPAEHSLAPAEILGPAKTKLVPHEKMTNPFDLNRPRSRNNRG